MCTDIYRLLRRSPKLLFHQNLLLTTKIFPFKLSTSCFNLISAVAAVVAAIATDNNITFNFYHYLSKKTKKYFAVEHY